MSYTFCTSNRLNLVNLAGVKYSHLVGPASGQGDYQVSTIQESYLVAFADLRDFLLAVFTTPQSFGASAGGAGVTYTIKVPQQHTNFTNLYAYSFQWEAVKQVSGSTVDTTPWTYVKVTLGFKSFEYQMTGDNPFFSRRVGGTGQIVTLPRTYYHFTGTPTLKIDQAVGRLIPQKEILLTRHKLPLVDESLLDSLVGCVNSGSLTDINDEVYDAGTVLFNSYSTNWQRNWDGTLMWDATYSIVWRPVAWNAFVNPATYDWDIILDPGGNPIYTAVDLSVLWT